MYLDAPSLHKSTKSSTCAKDAKKGEIAKIGIGDARGHFVARVRTSPAERFQTFCLVEDHITCLNPLGMSGQV